MSFDLVKLIENSQKEIREDFDKMLVDFLSLVDGYSQLNDDGNNICKIFLCVNVLMKLERGESK